MFRRALVVLFGFVVACLAGAAAKVAFVITPGEIASLGWDAAMSRLGVAGLLALASGIQAAIFSAPLALLAVGIAEWRRRRTWTYYATAGVLIAVLGFVAQYLSEAQGQPTIVNNYAFTAFLTEGFVAGFVYWMIAGRNAGGDRTSRLVTDGAPASRGSVPVVDMAHKASTT